MYWLITEKQVLSQLTKIAMAKIPFVTFSKCVIKNMYCEIQNKLYILSSDLARQNKQICVFEA